MSSKSYIRALKNSGPKPDRSPPDNTKRTAQLQQPPPPRPTMHDVGTQTSPHLYLSSSMDPFVPDPQRTPSWLQAGDDGMKREDKWRNVIFCPDPSIAFAGAWDEVIPRPPPPRLPSIERVQEESPAEWMGWKEKVKDAVDEAETDAVSPLSSGAVGSAGSDVSPLSPASHTDTGNKTSPAHSDNDRFRSYDPKDALSESRYPSDDKSVQSSDDETPATPVTKSLQKTTSDDELAKRNRRIARQPSPLPVVKDGMGCKGDRLQDVPQEKPKKDHSIAVIDDYMKPESPPISPDWALSTILCPGMPFGTIQLGAPPFVNDEPVICMLNHGSGYTAVLSPGQGRYPKQTDAVQQIGAKQHGQEARLEREAQDESKEQRKARKKVDRKEAKKAAKKGVRGIEKTDESAHQDSGPSTQAASTFTSSPEDTPPSDTPSAANSSAADTLHLLAMLPGSDFAGAATQTPCGRRNAVSGPSSNSAESSKMQQVMEVDDMGDQNTTEQPCTDRNTLFTTPDYDGSTTQVSGPRQDTLQISPRSLLPSAYPESASQLDIPIDNDEPIICMRVHSIGRRPMCQGRSPLVRDRTVATLNKAQRQLEKKRAEKMIHEQHEPEVVAVAFKRLERQIENEGYDYLSAISLDVVTYEIGADDEMPSVQEARAVSMHRVRPQQVHSVITHRSRPPKGTRRLQKRGRHLGRGR